MQYPSPDQPSAVKAINKIGAFAQSLGLKVPGLDPEKLIAKAQKQTGLDDFGDPSFREGLDRLIEALEREARLSQIGRIGTQVSLMNHLRARLQLVDHRKRHPQRDI